MGVHGKLTKVKEVTLKEVTHDCGYKFMTNKTKDIQCFKCKKRFDLE